MPAPPPGIRNPFVLADTNKVGNSMAIAGFIDMRTDTVIVAFEFASGEDYSCYCQAVSSTARIALSGETEERREDIWRKVAEEAKRNYGTGDGYIRMNNESKCVVGTRP